MTSPPLTHRGLKGHRLPGRPTAITALQVAFLAWAAVELAAGRPGNAVALVATFAVLQVPRLLRLPVLFDVAFLVAWTLQELGQVAGFWSRFPWWDTLVHTAMPAVLAPTAVILLIRVGALPDVLRPARRIQALGAVMLVFLVAAGFGSVYEIYEWTSDSHLGTHYQPDNSDTMTDTTANAIGGLAGGALLVAAVGRRRREGE
jgi:hypothetical protein